MMRRLRSPVLVTLLILGVLAPKLSVLALHLNPYVTAIVICDGHGMTTIHVDADGQPVDVTSTNHGDCIVVNADQTIARLDPDWRELARSYTRAFSEIEHVFASAQGVARLPDPRGPPSVG